MIAGKTSNTQVKYSFGLINDQLNTTPNMINKLYRYFISYMFPDEMLSMNSIIKGKSIKTQIKTI